MCVCVFCVRECVQRGGGGRGGMCKGGKTCLLGSCALSGLPPLDVLAIYRVFVVVVVCLLACVII